MPDLPFGGKNLIGAGDFSQLPPVIGGAGRALFSGFVGNGLTSGLTHHDQESAIGKALWHQITNVVILRRNMRQIGQSDKDRRFRLALENMRYKSCTLEDIACLQSRIVSNQFDHPSLLCKEFRNVSIITAWNSQKDRINELGCERFAKDTNQTLTCFYSEDIWISDSNVTNMSSKTKTHHKIVTYLNKEEEHILWNSAPHTSEHFAGCLQLCLGMPIIIKHNDATELCINNGQEGIVVGWTTSTGFHDQLLLETLFVKLEKPVKVVQLQNLPPNVVPISYTHKDICCTLPSDYVVRIRRRQLHILPNFAMTDYASQGKTRTFNVVDLSHCQSHHSYYTALSRSSTANGTAIVQGFDVSKITGGLSGWL
ncbi:P-loop containing nucleoside triphosphate hydrolase protein, partial [Boletus edulis BED1]